MSRCTICGYENDNLLSRCKNCGATISSPRSDIKPIPQSKLIGSKKIKEGIDSQNSDLNNCPLCNYPMLVQNSTCPNCCIEEYDEKTENKRSKFSINKVRPQTKNTEFIKKPKARLSPLNFKAEPISIYGTKELVNKRAIEPEDNLVSEQGLLNFEFKSGKWHVGTQDFDIPIFIKLKAKAIIQDGDIILFGDGKMMEFRAYKTE